MVAPKQDRTFHVDSLNICYCYLKKCISVIKMGTEIAGIAWRFIGLYNICPPTCPFFQLLVVGWTDSAGTASWLGLPRLNCKMCGVEAVRLTARVSICRHSSEQHCDFNLQWLKAGRRMVSALQIHQCLRHRQENGPKLVLIQGVKLKNIPVQLMSLIMMPVSPPQWPCKACKPTEW